jgi:hypothetical protein
LGNVDVPIVAGDFGLMARNGPNSGAYTDKKDNNDRHSSRKLRK